jgi:hypothetical protein
MSVVARRYQDLFQVERRPARTASSAVDGPQVEHYRSLYEESQCSTVAAQAEVTSLQVQLDQAHMELAAQESSIRSLTEECSLLRSQVAVKDENLKLFNQKLAAIKARVTKIDKQRRLALDCVLRCSRELCTQAISPEEFHSALDLILSSLTPLPHLLATSSSSPRGEAEFGAAAQRRLASLPLPERRQQLAAVATGSYSAEQFLT